MSPPLGAFGLVGRVSGGAPPAVPVVTAVSPVRGKAYGGTLVTLTGTGFTDAVAVRFHGLLATDLVVVNDTTITCKTPPDSHGLVDVEVEGPAAVSAPLVSGYKYLSLAGIADTLTVLRHYGQNYDAFTGTWTDEAGNFDAIVPAGTTPAATTPGSATLPNGCVAVGFDGATDVLVAGAFNDHVLAGPGAWLGGVMSVSGPGPDAPYDHLFGLGVYTGYSSLIGYNWGEGDKFAACFDGGLTADYAASDAPPSGVPQCVQAWRDDAVTGPSAGVCTLVVDGAQQTKVGASAAIGAPGGQWSMGAVVYSTALLRGTPCVLAELFVIDGKPTPDQLDEMAAYLEDCIT